MRCKMAVMCLRRGWKWLRLRERGSGGGSSSGRAYCLGAGRVFDPSLFKLSLPRGRGLAREAGIINFRVE